MSLGYISEPNKNLNLCGVFILAGKADDNQHKKYTDYVIGPKLERKDARKAFVAVLKVGCQEGFCCHFKLSGQSRSHVQTCL